MKEAFQNEESTKKNLEFPDPFNKFPGINFLELRIVF